MNVKEFSPCSRRCRQKALIVFREPLDDTGEYTDVEVLFCDGEVVVDIS